eukprot:2056680-Prymnesium_polylepis.1
MGLWGRPKAACGGGHPAFSGRWAEGGGRRRRWQWVAPWCATVAHRSFHSSFLEASTVASWKLPQSPTVEAVGGAPLTRARWPPHALAGGPPGLRAASRPCHQMGWPSTRWVRRRSGGDLRRIRLRWARPASGFRLGIADGVQMARTVAL